ncbi:monovalent cation/H+ antiporter complex subunit F [Ancylobacter sp. 6x-1]|uniref:Monovalent cation/H+ antiporter complex subunit F n=1 Tax=Ancylobacter crimeensis TaxID=2579147 RepID=A0ABT0D736_9HYPH|nr:monovalent cation/H+ antiporter complex subunit F [Ancylobacter crimeensis]MCK0195762.1 monovalent cation/H+ antiporter complex subunit F [Ancylobacter crimeensis]
MDEFLLGAGLVIAALLALSMLALLRAPTPVDRMMAAQLVGSSGAAICLLVAIAADLPAIIDVALVLTLLAAFAAATMSLKLRVPPAPHPTIPHALDPRARQRRAPELPAREMAHRGLPEIRAGEGSR